MKVSNIMQIMNLVNVKQTKAFWAKFHVQTLFNFTCLTYISSRDVNIWVQNRKTTGNDVSICSYRCSFSCIMWSFVYILCQYFY